MKRLQEIATQLIRDEPPDLEQLGEYADDPVGSYAIRLPHNHISGFSYFNPKSAHSLSDAEYALEVFSRYKDEPTATVGIRAVATILIGGPAEWQLVNVPSAGMYGIAESSPMAYVESIGMAEVSSVKDTLRELGFSEQQLEMAPVKMGLGLPAVKLTLAEREAILRENFPEEPGVALRPPSALMEPALR